VDNRSLIDDIQITVGAVPRPDRTGEPQMTTNLPEMKKPHTMSVGRDYKTSSRYEYVIFAEDETVVTRKGGFHSSGAARRAGLLAAGLFPVKIK
jgi:hypothetical protein